MDWIKSLSLIILIEIGAATPLPWHPHKKTIKPEKYLFSVIFQVYDAPEKIESVDKSATEIKCGIRCIEAVFERTTTTTE